jgi:hypothetical protein
MVLRIKLRYPDAATFVEKFAINVGRSGLFLATRGLQPLGAELRFELRLLDDQVVLAGVGRVSAVYEPRDDRPEAPYGMAIEFMRVTRESRDLVLRMLERRREQGLGEPALPVPEGMEEGGEAAQRSVTRPRGLEPERPRIPRTSAIELVAHLAAQPAGDAPMKESLVSMTAEAVDLQRALQRARAIAGSASGHASDDQLDAELAELARPRPVEPVAAPVTARAARVPQPRDIAQGTVRGVTPARKLPARSASATTPPATTTTTTTAAASPAPAASMPASAPVAQATPPPSMPALKPTPTAPTPAPSRERFSMFTKRQDPDRGEAEHTPPPGFAPQATPPAQHLAMPRPGAPSTLAAAAQIHAEQEAAALASQAAHAHAEPAPSSDADTTESDAEPRRRRIGRPERLTRPPGVFARGRAGEGSATAEEVAEVVDVGDDRPESPARVTPEGAEARDARHARSAAPTATAAVLAAAEEVAEVVARRSTGASAEAGAGRAMSEATFERVLAELEEVDHDATPRPPIAPRAAAHAPSPASVPYDPLDQLALDDLDDAEPPAGRRTPAPWYATVDETVPTTPVDLDDSGFEILAEAELAGHDLLEGTAAEAPRLAMRDATVPPRGHDDGRHHDDAPREPITARSALAAAVSRPTWTRSTALDHAEPSPPPANELAPPTIPGRVPTREIDLESALDALDIEAEAPVVPLRPRNELADDDDEFPIELEFDD